MNSYRIFNPQELVAKFESIVDDNGVNGGDGSADDGDKEMLTLTLYTREEMDMNVFNEVARCLDDEIYESAIRTVERAGILGLDHLQIKTIQATFDVFRVRGNGHVELVKKRHLAKKKALKRHAEAFTASYLKGRDYTSDSEIQTLNDLHFETIQHAATKYLEENPLNIHLRFDEREGQEEKEEAPVGELRKKTRHGSYY